MFKNKNKNNQRKGSKLYISKKSYNNPYFKNANKLPNKSFSVSVSLKAKIVIAFVLTFIVLFFWFMFYSKYFLIHDINVNIERVNNIGRVSEPNIEEMVRGELRRKFVFLPANNYFLFNENKIYKKLNKDYAFEKIEVNKVFPNKLSIHLKEVSYALVWHEDGKYYYITTDGNIISEIKLDEIKQIFPIIDNKGRYLIDNNKINNRDGHLKLAITLYKEFKDTNVFNIESFLIGNQNDSTLTMKIFEGPEVYFNVNGDTQSQSEKLLLLKNEKLRGALYDKKYIDLRYGDMIYYK